MEKMGTGQDYVVMIVAASYYACGVYTLRADFC